MTTTTQLTSTTIPSEHHVRPQIRTALRPGTATEVSVDAGRHRFTIDEPASLGGTDLGANPVDHLLAALGACNVITYQVWAEKLGIRLDGVEIELAGDIDIRGFFGIDPDVRPGFQGIEARVTLRGPESAERYVELRETVEAHCPVLDNLTAGVPVTVVVDVAA
ncbi:OsmC family protein [Intrasporangium sp.]|uniref:OsmC family protein n=1 Tax=Intrasporangium sp. TaxID=1925024 RepID=UPI002939ACE5|nr:OsmC family protein [Intrasporangium sp.]MDV3220285.1 OsmC family protein [Intrasporangium sp.]